MDPLAVLGDPTRRRLVEMLAERDLAAGELASAFDVTRPAISRHLRLLREAGVVTVEQSAQRRIYRLDPTALDEVEAWVARMRTFWTQRLDALETELTRGNAHSHPD